MTDTTRKTQLLSLIQAEHSHLETLINSLDEATLDRPGVVGDWSIKVVLAHLTWWEQQALGVLRGEPDIVQPEGEPWEITQQRINTQTYEASKDRPLSEILSEWRVSYQQVLQAIEGLSNEELAREEVYDDLAGNTFEHYQDHRQAIAAALGLDTGNQA